MDTPKLGIARAEVIKMLGTPLRETQRDDLTILWFGSKAPSQATFYYLKNDVLVIVSEAPKTTQTLKHYFDANGKPAQSVRRYDDTIAEDTPTSTVHVWPDKGLSVISYGSDASSIVEREEHFAPMTLKEYQESWGKARVGNQEITVTVATSASQQVTQTRVPVSNTQGENWFFMTVVFAAVVIFVIVRIRRKPPQAE